MNREITAALSSLLPDEPCLAVRKRVALSTLTSMGVGGDAACVLTPRDGACLIRLLDRLRAGTVPYRVIGLGTNLIGPDAGYPGVLVLTAGIDRVSVTGNTLVCGSGVPLGRAIRRAMEAGLSGLEELFGIPGTVGGALYMNAGAYGRTVSERLRYATVYHPASGEVTVMTPGSLVFGYRTGSIREEGMIVLSAAFDLTQSDPATVAGKMTGIVDRRKATQPLGEKSAGSFFRRPAPDIPAGKLIAEAGCAGLTEGGAAVSTLHAGFILNRGGATEHDVTRLAERVRAQVLEKTGFRLEPEVEYLTAPPDRANRE